MTDELNVGHYVKRLTAIDATFGDARSAPRPLLRRRRSRATEAPLRQPAKKWKQLV